MSDIQIQKIGRKKILFSVGVAGFAMAATVGLGACSSNASNGSASDSPSASSTVEALSTTTHITWDNQLGEDLTFAVSEVDNSDWDGDTRPDHSYPNGIQGYTLKSGDSLKETLTVNSWNSSARFTLKATDSAGNTVFTTGIRRPTGQNWHLEDDLVITTKKFTYTDASGNEVNGRLMSKDDGSYDSIIRIAKA